jgi:hypothetical protein
MERQRLRAVLQTGSTAVFDCRPKSENIHEVVGDSSAEFFEQRVLRNAIVFKFIKPDDSSESERFRPVQSIIYFPFDAKNPGDGGSSISYDPATIRGELRRKFGSLDVKSGSFERDLSRLQVLSSVPNFSPFLLKDAFERAKIECDGRYFAISDSEADEVKFRLKQRISALAAKSLNVSPDHLASQHLDTLVRRLWDLDDLEPILPLSRALRLPDDEAIDVIYAWIGVSYFETEYLRREKQMLALAQWLVTDAEKIGVRTSASRQDYQIRLNTVRQKLKRLWRDCKEIFARYNDSFSCLVLADAEAKPFIEFLKRARMEFWRIGELLLLMYQCMSIFDVYRPRNGMIGPNFERLEVMIRCHHEVLSEYRAA